MYTIHVYVYINKTYVREYICECKIKLRRETVARGLATRNQGSGVELYR